MQAGAVDLSLQLHASELPKPRWQESVGRRELRAVPRHSQPAVKWFLRDKKEQTAGQRWVPVASAGALDLGALCPFRGEGDITAIKPLAVRSEVAAHREPGAPSASSQTIQTFLDLPARHQAHCSSHNPASCKLQASFLSNLVWESLPFPFSSQYLFSGRCQLAPQLWHSRKTLNSGTLHCPQLASCTNRPL